MKELPEFIYARPNDLDDDDDDGMEASVEPGDIVRMEEEAVIGLYELVRAVTATNRTSIS